jgi:hypothetical protein
VYREGRRPFRKSSTVPLSMRSSRASCRADSLRRSISPLTFSRVLSMSPHITPGRLSRQPLLSPLTMTRGQAVRTPLPSRLRERDAAL